MRFTYSFHPDRPRILTRDLSILLARSNDAAGWKTLYDQKMIPECATILGEAIQPVAADKDHAHNKVLTLAVCGVNENNATWRQRAIDILSYYAGTYAGTSGYTDTTGLHNGAQLLAYGLDLLDNSPEMTSGARLSIINGLVKVGDLTQAAIHTDGGELIDGISARNAANTLLCGVALGSSDSHGAEYVQSALEFWWGQNPGNPGRIDYDRWYSSQGGSGKGAFYCLYSQQYTQILLRAMYNGFVRCSETAHALQIDGEDYSVYEDEDWVGKVGEWVLRFGFRGDKDFLSMGDTMRITNPVFSEYYQTGLAFLCDVGGSWRSALHWLWNQEVAWNDFLNQMHPARYALSFCAFDKAAVAAAHPKTLSIPPAKFFQPPGCYHLIYPSFDPPNACDVTISLEQWDYRGHKHRDCGTIQVGVGDDRVLLDTGIYATTDPLADYQGPHNNRWMKQSIAHSGVPLIEGLAADLSDRHGNRDENGDRAWFPNGLGGQNWKWVGGFNGTWNPGSVPAMLADGGGLAWRRCTSWATLGGAADFVRADLRRAYVCDAADYGGSTERVRLCDLRILVIKGFTPWPVIFRVARVKSRLPTMKKRDHWHFHGQPQIEGSRFWAPGYLGHAKILIDYFGAGDLVYSAVGGGAQSGGIGAYDFFYDGANWRPTYGPSWRNAPDCGHYRVEVTPAVPKEEDYFVSLLMPMRVGETPAPYSLFEEANWYGLDLSGVQFRIHKTEDQCIIGGADMEPPQVPQFPAAAAGPGTGQGTVTWSPNTDDTAIYRLYYR